MFFYWPDGRKMISVIILTKNELENLKRLLPILLSQNGVGRKEILVIDSGSTDGTLAYLKRQPIRLIKVKPTAFGHGKTRNLAINKARGDRIVFISPDAVPVNNQWLSLLNKPLVKPEVWGVFGRQLPQKNASLDCRFFYLQAYPGKSRSLGVKNLLDFGLSNLFFSNVNSIIKKEAWEKIPFPSQAFMSEDQLWAYEVLKRGYCIYYQAEAEVIHSHNYTYRDLFRRFAASGYSLKGLPLVSLTNKGRGLLNYYRQEFEFVIQKGKINSFPDVFLRELIKLTAWSFGRKCGILPKNWRKKLLYPARKRLEINKNEK